MKRKLLLLISLFAVMGLSELNAQTILGEYLQTAAQNNPALKSAFNNYMSAVQKSPQVKSLPDPQLAFSYFIQPIETRMGPQRLQLSLAQAFPWFGTLKAKGNAADAQAQAKLEQFKQKRSELFNQVRGSYYTLFYIHQAIKVTEDNLSLLKSLREIALIKIKAGKSSLSDEYRIEMEIGDLSDKLALLKDQFISRQVNFNSLLNRESHKNVELPDSLWEATIPLSKEELLDSIQQQNHQLQSLSEQSTAYNYQQEAAKKAGLPQFKVGVGYNVIGKGSQNLEGKDAIVFPSVGLSIPIYRKKYRAMVDQAVYAEKSVKDQQSNQANLLKSLFANNWKNYQDAIRRIDLNRNQASLARKTIDLLETDYSSDSKNFEEVIRMERRLLKYKLELVKAHTDKLTALSVFELLMGN